MKLRKFTLAVFGSSVFAALLLFDGMTKTTISNVGAPPTGRTGSPGDVNLCTGCHTGTAVVTTPGLITSNIPPAGYLPGQTYTLTASITGTGSRYGFEVCCESATNAKVGTLVVTNTTTTQLLGSPVRWIGHKTGGTTGTGGKTWTFNWIAPALGTGTVTFYAAFNKANNNASSSGDAIVKSSLQVPEDPSAGFAEYDVMDQINIFPNPVSDVMTIETEMEDAQAGIYDLQGKLLLSSAITGFSSTINVSELGAGVYFITISSAGKVFSKKFVKL